MNPLAGIYAAASGLRNRLYDRGSLRSRKLGRPVVSVGNLSTGGAGKTPFVIALGELLKWRGVSFDVLSRGYGRRTRGVLVVEPDGAAADFGDEPLLIARKLGVPVIVGESRYEAGLLAEKKFDSQLHILDDGFQHRSLARDFDIVLVTGQDFDDGLLPSGRLREPLCSLARADAIVVATDVPATRPELSGRLIWRMTRQIAIPDPPRSPIVFCGIARPEQFFAQVRAAGVLPAAEVKFRDHHGYDRDDIQALIAARRDCGAGGFLTTAKDEINLAPERHLLEPLAIASLSLQIEKADDMVDTVLAGIGKLGLGS